uniref:CDP-alcohol phosphatidyltransferase family protein n=1 Tax=Legionella tunisiensis TaxID=1034944 RepID=UPI000306A382|nr:CDP-alcohol phosphatidyltransferase family protein [Legionella tunisiensis]
MLLAIFIESSWLLILFPIVLFLRMALNAIDGLLAKEHDQKTPLGAILNELTDMAADAALYLPFALYPGISNLLIIAIVILALLSEATGLSGLLVGASRRYDGPMGKSDRAFIFSLLAIWLALFLSRHGLIGSY